MAKRIAHLFFALALFVAQIGVGDPKCVAETSDCCAGCCSETTADANDAADQDLPPCCQLADRANDGDITPAAPTVTPSVKLTLFISSINFPPPYSSEPQRLSQFNLSLGNAASPPLYISFASLLI